MSKSVGLKRRPALAGDDWLNILPKTLLSKTKLRIKTKVLEEPSENLVNSSS